MQSDVVLACLFPLMVLFLLSRFMPEFSWSAIRSLFFLSQPRANPFSPETAYSSYARYREASYRELSRMRTSYTTIGRMHKRIGYDIGYPAKLTRLQDTIESNAFITDQIAQLSIKHADSTSQMGATDLYRVHEALKHFVRDWSDEGATERAKIFTPILDVLRTDLNPDTKRVLVPGAGLCRLAWDISQMGFDTTANELSGYMNLAFNFLVTPETTSRINQHCIYPYAHWFSHQRSNSSLFRSIMFPDAVPRLSANLHHAPENFLSLPIPQPFDYIITLFFIDTSINVLATLEHIYSLLRPGGTWINLGPLLWTSGGNAKLELNLEEVVHAAETIGFVFCKESSRTIECEYTADQSAMMRWIYLAEFWLAQKPVS